MHPDWSLKGFLHHWRQKLGSSPKKAVKYRCKLSKELGSIQFNWQSTRSATRKIGLVLEDHVTRPFAQDGRAAFMTR